MTSLRSRMIEDMQIRNLAVDTQQAYVQQVSLFARVLLMLGGLVASGSGSAALWSCAKKGLGARHRKDVRIA